MPVADSGPTGASLVGQPPVVRGQVEELVLAEVALEDQRDARAPRCGRISGRIRHGRLEAALVADAELDTRPRSPPRSPTSASPPRGRQRLLAEHVLAGRGGRHDLLGVEPVRGAQHDRVDGRCAASASSRSAVVGTLDGARGRPGRGRRRGRRARRRWSARSATILWPHHPRPTTAALITARSQAAVPPARRGPRREYSRRGWRDPVSPRCGPARSSAPLRPAASRPRANFTGTSVRPPGPRGFNEP